MEEIQAYGPVDTWDPPPSPQALSIVEIGTSALNGAPNLLSLEAKHQKN